MNISLIRSVLLSSCLFAMLGTARAEDPLKVVTTLSSYASIAATIGGDRVEVVAIASPKFNPHFIEPRPSDVFKLKRADLFIHSGLDLEAWRRPLVDASARSEIRDGGVRSLDLSDGVTLLEVPAGQVSRSEGDIHQFGNPHYWIDPRNGLIMASHITAKLSEIDPGGRTGYETRLHSFTEVLKEKMVEWRTLIAPYAGREVLGYHREWPYLMDFMGLSMKMFLEPKPGIPPGPQHLAKIVEYAKENGVKAIVQTTYSSSEGGDFLAANAGVKTVVVCQNVGELSECPDYIAMVDYSVRQIAAAVR